MHSDNSGFPTVIGDVMVDDDGRRVGKVVGMASRPDTLEPEWLVVRTSLFGRRRLVPVASAVQDGQTLHVLFSKEAILGAPQPEVPTSLAASERRALLEHYAHAA
jgi:hypothetical protein